MMGENYSFMNYDSIITEQSQTFVLGCICHSAHLIASHAADVLPKHLED
jgi:hypothetical protein